MDDDVVLGLDGGGTRTRVAVADRDGCVLGHAERGGASIEFNDPETARQNLEEGVRAALSDAGRSVDDVAAVTAGIAGLGLPDAVEEARRALDIDGLDCETRVVTDAEVAHIGAFQRDPGVVAICGTGSIVFGITADGDRISNYDCVHHAHAGARTLGERALHAILAREAPADWALADDLLDHWGYESEAALRAGVRDEDRFSDASPENPLDRVAPLITAAAADGDACAGAICDDAVTNVVTGIRVVGGYLDTPVSVAPVGSVLTSGYMAAELRRRISDFDGYQHVDPAMSPVRGAVFDAIDRVGGAGSVVVEQLSRHTVEND